MANSSPRLLRSRSRCRVCTIRVFAPAGQHGALGGGCNIAAVPPWLGAGSSSAGIFCQRVLDTIAQLCARACVSLVIGEAKWLTPEDTWRAEVSASTGGAIWHHQESGPRPILHGAGRLPGGGAIFNASGRLFILLRRPACPSGAGGVMGPWPDETGPPTRALAGGPR